MKNTDKKIRVLSSPVIDDLKHTRWVVRCRINELIKSYDSIEKFNELVKLTKEFKLSCKKLAELGVGTRKLPHPELFETSYWEDKLKSAGGKPSKIEKPVKTKKEKPKEITQQKSLYNIMLCWTARADYCVCDSIINAVRDYLIKMKLEKVDSNCTKFIDKVEYSEIYQISITKEIYDVIISSAQYILDISTDSVYDKCNVGVFGKEIKI